MPKTQDGFWKNGMMARAAGGFASIVACSALFLGLMPIAAHGDEGFQVGALADSKAAERARQIDSLGDYYEAGSIIVVYRDDAPQSLQADKGMATQSLSVANIQGATADMLSADSGTPGGGAAFSVDLPDGVSVGKAVVAAEKDPQVMLAQPNFTYYFMHEEASVAPSPEEGSTDTNLGYEPGAADKRDSASRQADMLQRDNQPLAAQANVLDYDGDYALPDDPYVSVDYNDTSDSPSTPNQWWIHAVNAPQAWSLAHGNDKDVAVAVIDTGIDFDHEDLKANILADYAYDACYGEKLVESIDNDEMQHGCHVAGIIAAEADNGKGIAGVSYNAKILPIRAFRLQYNPVEGMERAYCTDEDLIRAYDYLLSDHDGDGRTIAQETNTRVVNMSLGGYLQDDLEEGETLEEAYDYLFEDKIEQAEAAGILTVAAAGNGDSYGNPRTDASYPSDYPAVMSVIALKTPTARTQWSDHNAMKNISAPGNNIYSTYWTGNPPYKFESGTSMASPLVAGCAALLWSYDPTLSVRDVKDVLYGTATDLGAEGFDEYYGWGCVNIGAALTSLGTASVSLERSTMVRTTTQQLSATPISDSHVQHAWKWSVDDPAVARIDDQGVLTAVSTGRVVVSATAVDDPSIEGHRSVEVVDITLPGAVTASANPQLSAISLSWGAAEGATCYKVYRAVAAPGTTNEPGEFLLLGTYASAELVSETSASFFDETAEPSQLYWYRVVPVGELDELLVDGVGQTSNRCFFTDKKALKANIDKAEELLASTSSSIDGSDVLATAYWTTSSARDALNLALSGAYNAYMSGSMFQSKVDAYNEALAEALRTFEDARATGLKKIENTLKASAKPGVHSAVYGTSAVFKAADLYTVTGAQGAVTFAAANAAAGISVGADGSIAVGKTAPVGSHAIVVNVKAAGTASALPKTMGVTVNVLVNKAANGLKATAKAPKVSYNAKGAQTIAVSKAFVVSGAQGKLSYAKTSGSKALSVNAKTGAISVAKGTSVGAYKVRVSIRAAGDVTHVAKSTSVGLSVKVLKAANGLAVKAKNPTVSYNAKKPCVVSASKALRVTGAAGAVSYKKLSGSKLISVNAKTGAFTVKKGAKRATYSIKVKVRAAGTKNYKALSRTVTVRIKVK